MAQDRAGKLREEALDEVEPGTVRGRKGEFEAAGRSGGEPSFGFSRNLGGMIVENQLACGAGRIGDIKKLEELDELAGLVAASDEGMNLPRERINSDQQAERAIGHILMI